jgi:hypothetical protein
MGTSSADDTQFEISILLVRFTADRYDHDGRDDSYNRTSERHSHDPRTALAALARLT